MAFRCFIFFFFLSLAAPVVMLAQAEKNTRTITVKSVVIEGNKKTRASVIFREMSVHDSCVISKDSLSFLLMQNKLRIFNTALFNEVLIDTVWNSDTEMIWYVRVKERWNILPEFAFQLADRNLNVWWTEQHRDLHRANIGLTLKDHNFRGNLEELSAGVQIGYTQKISLEYFRPYANKKQKGGFGFSFSVGQNQEIYYATDSNKQKFAHSNSDFIFRQLNAGVLYTYRPAYATRHLVELAYHDYKVADTILKLNANYFANGSKSLQMLELYYRFDMNKVDNWNYPLSGFKLISSTTIRAGITGMKFQAFTNIETGLFRCFAPKWFVSGIVRGRLSVPEDQPYALRTALGTKTDYVRGYEYYVADGSDYGIVRFDLRRQLVNHTFHNIGIRYLPNIPVRIYPKIFADAGYGRNPDPGNSFLNNRMLYSAGIGMDIVTAYDFKCRLEYTVNHLGQYALYIHFNSE